MSSGSNQSSAIVARRKPPLTFLTLPPGIRETVYNFCGLFQAKQVNVVVDWLHEYFGTQIMYTCRQIYEEVHPRFYSSKSFTISTEFKHYVDRIGVRNGRAICTILIPWRKHKFGLMARFDILEGLEMQSGENMRYIRAMAISLDYPWRIRAYLKDEDVAAALKTIRDVAQDPRNTNLFRKKIFAGSTRFGVDNDSWNYRQMPCRSSDAKSPVFNLWGKLF